MINRCQTRLMNVSHVARLFVVARRTASHARLADGSETGLRWEVDLVGVAALRDGGESLGRLVQVGSL